MAKVQFVQMMDDGRGGPMDRYALVELLGRIDYRDWRFRVGPMGGGHFLQVEFDAPEGRQRGGKWYVSTHAMPGEVLRKALQAVLAAEEHEARERFKFAGKAVFHPHHPISALVEIADRLEGRP